MVNKICLLFGHTGRETESGYHVCSRCGLHEYHCPEYVREGYIWEPYIWMKKIIKKTCFFLKKKLEREDANLPF